MYTLTRKLSVVCLTVVLSFLVYGCGGSSKQALITDVSTEMVTAGLTPDAGTYNIQPSGTATAGDVTFACPAEGSSCEVTVADDGTVTSAGGMATAMTSASAAARLAAEQAQATAETERDAANAAAMLAATAQADAETARDAANAAAMLAATERDAANAAAMTAETERDAANAAAMLAATAQADAETARDAANAAAMLAATAQADAETARDAANAAAMLAATAQADAETARDAANAAAMLSATERDAANAAAMLSATERDAANARAMLAATAQADAETERDAANARAMLAATAQADAETERDAANARAMLAATAQADAETERDAANARAMLAATAQANAETERDAANARAMLAATAQANAETAQANAERDRDVALAALILANLRADPHDVDTSDLLTDYMTMTPGTYNIEPGKNRDVDDVNFACPAGRLACEVKVDEDGTVVSSGGMATAQNSMAAMTTRTAIALYAPDDEGMSTGALVTASTVGPVIGVNVENESDSVTRSPEGDTEIELGHVADTSETNKYTSEVVDTGHEIDGWMGQTLKRDDSIAATMDVEAVSAERMDEVTIYTNIDPATRGKLKYEGPDNAIPAITVIRIEVEEDLMTENADGDTFKGAFIRTDGTRIPGTFTCDADEGCADIGATVNLIGTHLLVANPGAGWEFESNQNVEEGETPDTNYMYFGYWLNSPVDGGTTYEFAVFNGGNQTFAIDALLSDENHALTATYKGGAAGRYVTRELRVKDGSVDPISPGFHGRFTAKAVLKAYFGRHMDFAADIDVTPVIPIRQNRVEGTITEFMDGDTELGFKVKLGLTEIAATGSVTGDGSETGVATATFGKPGDSEGSGTWEAQFYGPSPAGDEDASDPVKNRTLPSGIAGEFDVESSYTKVVGAFAAKKQ